jgi:L-lysine exporter family protein LysE/ArgO
MTMQQFCITPLLEGFGTSAGLIIAIGAQNAFVLKQGILKNHVFVTATLCFILDAVLITLGIAGFGKILTSNAILLSCARWGGAAFLLYYGFRSFRSVLRSGSLTIDIDSRKPNLQETLVSIFALTLLNPHVYLDTVILVGSIGSQFQGSERLFFTFGAIAASFVWFFGMGYGARYLAPFFKKPTAWKILDFMIGCVMTLIALTLLFGMQDMGCAS